MKSVQLAEKLKSKTTIVLLLVGFFIAVILGVLIWRSRPAPNNTTGATGNTISNAEIISEDNSGIKQALASHDYQEAINLYIEASNIAQANGNLAQGETFLLDATKKIPHKDLPWVVWNNLVGVSQARGDKSVEINSLKEAESAAQQLNSGAPISIVQTYKKMLAKLGVD